MTELAGILNLTPDSFSGDGMLALEPGEALRRIDAMAQDGAAIVDIGAESTRPRAQALTPEAEWLRLKPLVESASARARDITLSIDTRHAGTARKAVAAGFRWINDVSGGADAAMMELAAETGSTLVLMHSLGVPADPSRILAGDPVEEICRWGQEVLKRAERHGLDRDRIVLDPGIGFGKTATQSLALIKHIARLKSLGAKVLVGHSRKSFLSLFVDAPAQERDAATLVVSSYLASQGVDYLRVHDVKSHATMLRMQAAL